MKEKSKFSLMDLKDEKLVKLVKKTDKKILAVWAIDCAERVMPYFKKEYPKDSRPRKAIEALQEWIDTGIFSMKVIRKASLDSHAAARKAKADGNDAACFAARAAGHSVATAHVPQHAYGPSYYALKAVAAADPIHANTKILKEYNWQSKHFPKNPGLKKGWEDWRSKRLPKELKKVLGE